ncbi:hypothetical protein [Gulosibacter faecalis]|uniref:Asparagine synthetase domain-containing protein n=1 Tax=Gulosibacter faecalis TaxID=272240 RepID=A0ABW5V068_9MICO|nr:hypothetical protein [Gulosibacter faecalis]
MGDLAKARLYARGYLLSPEITHLFDDISYFDHIVVGGQYHLYFDEILEIDVAVSGPDWCLVVGKAWPLSSGKISPDSTSVARQLLDLHVQGWDQAVEEALYDVAGRYMIMLKREHDVLRVYNDACGTRSVYYNSLRREVASHFDILDRLTPETSSGEPYGVPLKLEKLWDKTANENVRSLIPNFRLDLIEGTQTRFFGTDPNMARSLSEEGRFALIERLWKEQLQKLVEVSGDLPIAFSMTGGFDSRTSLAMAREYKDLFTSFTYTTQGAVDGKEADTNWGRAMALDYSTVRKMEEFLPLGHSYIARAQKHATWVAANSGILDRNQTRTHGRWILPGYLELFSDPRTIHLRGNLQEIGRLHMGRSAASPEKRFVQLITYGTNLAKDDLARLVDYTSAGYEKHRYPEVTDNYDIGDIWYWEHRHGRWYSEVLNETDTVFDTVSPINVRRILDCYLAFPEFERKQAYAQYTLTHRNHPSLLFFGINSADDLYEVFVRPTLRGKIAEE